MAVNNSLVAKSKAQQNLGITEYLTKDAIKNQINKVVGGKNGQRFISAIVSAYNTNPTLQECTNQSILSAALLGESLQLSPSPQLGHYYMVPFNNTKTGVKEAQFQMGYKGYIQLAIRSGQYKRLNVVAIKEGELEYFDPLNEDIKVNLMVDDWDKREEAETIGYYAMFELVNGFRKTMYWSKAQMLAHADKYAVELLGYEKPEYCRTMEEVEASTSQIVLTNYERVRDGDIDPSYFAATSLDEASVLRSFGSKTYQTFLDKFKNVPYKLVATATPSPNKYKELIHYAGYLEVMDTGQALTRFFQRDSTKANNLTLYPNMEDEFWLWVSSWALFITKPSDINSDYSDDGYVLPPLDVRWHEIPIHYGDSVDRDGQMELFTQASTGLEVAGLSSIYRMTGESWNVQSFQFNRYVSLYDGICALLSTQNRVLRLVVKDGYVTMSSAVPYDYTEDKDCMRSDINYNITQIKNRYNHLICLGQGELKDRQVLHLYIDKRGNITDTQAFKGFEERTAVYDYSSATDMDELKSGGIARLQELNADRLDMTLPDMAMQIGDITGGTEKFTGATVKKQITNIIAKIDDNSIDIEYSVS